MAHPEGDASLSRQGKGFTVQASPFNAIKLDLALIIIMAVVLLLVHNKLVENTLAQLGLLLGYGVVSMFWIVIRTRRIAARQMALEQSGANDDNISKSE